MKPLLESFGLSQKDLNPFLKLTDAVIAGSAPLAAATDLAFQPNDLDIWVHADRFRETFPKTPEDHEHYDLAVYMRLSQIWMWESFLGKYGYKPEYPQRAWNGILREGYSEGPLAEVIRCVKRFKHAETGKQIQVIHTKIPVQKAILTFDLSVCMTYYNGAGQLFSYDPEGIQTRTAFSLRNKDGTKREDARQKKYEARGFTLLAPGVEDGPEDNECVPRYNRIAKKIGLHEAKPKVVKKKSVSKYPAPTEWDPTPNTPIRMTNIAEPWPTLRKVFDKYRFPKRWIQLPLKDLVEPMKPADSNLMKYADCTDYHIALYHYSQYLAGTSRWEELPSPKEQMRQKCEMLQMLKMTDVMYRIMYDDDLDWDYDSVPVEFRKLAW